MPLKIQNKAMYHSFINKYLQNIKFFRKKIEMKKKLEKNYFLGRTWRAVGAYWGAGGIFT